MSRASSPFPLSPIRAKCIRAQTPTLEEFLDGTASPSACRTKEQFIAVMGSNYDTFLGEISQLEELEMDQEKDVTSIVTLVEENIGSLLCDGQETQRFLVIFILLLTVRKFNLDYFIVHEKESIKSKRIGDIVIQSPDGRVSLIAEVKSKDLSYDNMAQLTLELRQARTSRLVIGILVGSSMCDIFLYDDTNGSFNKPVRYTRKHLFNIRGNRISINREHNRSFLFIILKYLTNIASGSS